MVSLWRHLDQTATAATWVPRKRYADLRAVYPGIGIGGTFTDPVLPGESGDISITRARQARWKKSRSTRLASVAGTQGLTPDACPAGSGPSGTARRRPPAVCWWRADRPTVCRCTRKWNCDPKNQAAPVSNEPRGRSFQSGRRDGRLALLTTPSSGRRASSRGLRARARNIFRLSPSASRRDEPQRLPRADTRTRSRCASRQGRRTPPMQRRRSPREPGCPRPPRR